MRCSILTNVYLNQCCWGFCRRDILAINMTPQYRSSSKIEFPVLLAEGTHPFPFRIRKLSPPASMVLAGQLAGRVDQCRVKIERGSGCCRALFIFNRKGGYAMKCDNCGKKQDDVDSECGWCTFCGNDQPDTDSPKS